jgi:hypothetical protein
MSPNQPCKPGNYCPYACPPGQVSMQWDPEATSYSYPMSMVSRPYYWIHLSYARGETRGTLTDSPIERWSLL